MADSEKLADLSARLRSLANGDENTQETSKSLLLEAAAVLGQSHSLENSYVLVLIDAHSHPVSCITHVYRTLKLYAALRFDKVSNMSH